MFKAVLGRTLPTWTFQHLAEAREKKNYVRIRLRLREVTESPAHTQQSFLFYG